MTTQPTKPTPRPVPTVAALYGASVDIKRILQSSTDRTLIYASLCVAADEAAHAMLGTKLQEPSWGFALDRDKADPAHAEARAGVHEYLLAHKPDVVIDVLLKRVGLAIQRVLEIPGAVEPVLVLHLASARELEVVRLRVPTAVAIGVVGKHDDEPYTCAEWPAVEELVAQIGSLPPGPLWLRGEKLDTYRKAWAQMMVDRIAEVAREVDVYPF
jgi:hypothetical protein